MKNLIWRLCFIGTVVGLAGFGRPTLASAQESSGPGDRIERLERQVHELAQRQEQFLQRFGSQLERQERMAKPSPENIRPPLPLQGAPLTGPQSPHGVKAAKGLHDALGLLFLIGIFCNILLAIWIFTDIRKRGEGSGIFVAMALVAGIPAALIYSLTRIGDKKT